MEKKRLQLTEKELDDIRFALMMFCGDCIDKDHWALYERMRDVYNKVDNFLESAK